AVWPDGRPVAAAYWDRAVRLWEVASSKQRAKFDGHRGEAISVSFSADGSLLASGSSDRTIVVWDVAGRHTVARPDKPDFDGLWTDLADADGAKAFRAVQLLTLVGDPAVKFVAHKLRPVPTGGVDAKRIAALIADLGHAQFAMREKAEKELTEIGDTVEPALR